MNKLTNAFKQLFAFFQLTDDRGRLSITNIATMVVIAKIALAVSIDWGVISALLITLLNYSHKRHVGCRSVHTPPDHSEAIELLESKLDEVSKVADEAKDKASKLSLATGLKTTSY